jgi:hypothetical protein
VQNYETNPRTLLFSTKVPGFFFLAGKKKLEIVAAAESGSVAQVCEAFLQAGLVAYEKEGPKYISRFLGVQEVPPKDRHK